MNFEEMGGRKMIELISKVFYDKIYDDLWLKQYFKKVPQEYIEKQQVDFMQAALGGPNVYAGKTPPHAHKHIYITDDVYKAREALLRASFNECNASAQLIDKWLDIDMAFYGRVVKTSKDDCIERYSAEGIIEFPKP